MRRTGTSGKIAGCRVQQDAKITIIDGALSCVKQSAAEIGSAAQTLHLKVTAIAGTARMLRSQIREFAPWGETKTSRRKRSIWAHGNRRGLDRSGRFLASPDSTYAVVQT